MAQDFSDNNGQKLAISFLSKAVTVWGQPPGGTNGNEVASQPIPGFEGFIYEQLVPLAFKIPSSSDFNPKDGQMMVVSVGILICSY